MKPEAALRSRPRELRVLVHTADAECRAQLEALVAAAGCDVVASLDEAEIVLADSDGPPVEHLPVLALGGAERDCAGSLDADATPDQIVAALRAVAAGLVVRSAPSTRGFGAMRQTMPHDLLSPRELEVLTEIGQGATNKMIAKRFGISLHTVKFHVESLFRKLGVRTRAEAVAKARERRREETFEI